MNYTLSVILPVINESKSLEKTVLSIEDKLSSQVLEYLVVSCAKTTVEAREMISQLMHRFPGKLRNYEQHEPGIGAAMWEAFAEVKGSHLVMMSSDLETDPAALPDLLEVSKENPCAIVAASRWMKGGGFRSYGALKWVLNRSFTKILKILFPSGLTDFTYGYRIYPLEQARNFKWKRRDHSFFLETLLKPLRAGTKVIEVPVVWIPREEGESNIRFSSYFNYVNTALGLRFGRQ